MARQVVSRTQRRMEKKQALILLFLILAVSLVSFTLGVMVGRGASGSPPAAEAPAPARLPVAQEAPAAAPAPVPAPAAPKGSAEDLTFYDTLPKGEQPPLGSGINHPPAAKEPEAASAAPVPAKVPAPAPAKAAEPAPAAGSYVVQAASFRLAEEARALQEKLAAKGHSAYVEAADLGAKGVWHRVYVGSFGSAEAAEAAVTRLQSEDKLSALVRKR